MNRLMKRSGSNFPRTSTSDDRLEPIHFKMATTSKQSSPTQKLTSTKCFRFYSSEKQLLSVDGGSYFLSLFSWFFLQDSLSWRHFILDIFSTVGSGKLVLRVFPDFVLVFFKRHPSFGKPLKPNFSYNQKHLEEWTLSILQFEVQQSFFCAVA